MQETHARLVPPCLLQRIETRRDQRVRSTGWEKVFAESRDTNTGFVLARADGIRKGTPDHEKFKSTFNNIIDYNTMEYENNPGFATVFAQDDDLENILKYLHLDFKQFFN